MLTSKRSSFSSYLTFIESTVMVWAGQGWDTLLLIIRWLHLTHDSNVMSNDKSNSSLQQYIYIVYAHFNF